MAILFSDSSYRSDKIFAAIREAMPMHDVRHYPNMGNPDEIDYALIWYPAPGSLQNLPNLKAIFTTSAGVDGIIGDTTLPANIPIIRNVDPALGRGVAEYVAYHVLRFYRHHQIFDRQQRECVWKQIRQPEPKECRIGMMGYGEIGKACVEMLLPFGFPIRTWSNSPKHDPRFTSYYGDAQFNNFLADVDILVNTLPLTSRTQGILNADCFGAMKDGAFVINVGRGRHLVEHDLLAALASGKIAHAALDVFQTEPLPQDHVFWSHPDITITPHIASITNIRTIVDNMLGMIANFESGIPFPHVVNRAKEY